MDKRSLIDPLEELKQLYKEANLNRDDFAGLVVFATAPDGALPQARIIELRDVLDEGLLVLVNSTSPKWKQLNEAGKYELLIYWHTFPIQVRVHGNYSLADEKLTEKYWQKQPFNFKILDHYYSRFKNQSEIIESEAKYHEEISSLKEAYNNSEFFDMPSTVKGLLLVPNKIEFWKGSHDFKIPLRELYTLTRSGWIKENLVP